MLNPGVVRALLHPEDAVVMGIGGEQVGQAILVEIDHEDEAGLAEVKLRMEFPVAATRVGRRFQPALRRNDVVPAIVVDVAGADTVAVTLRTDDVLLPRASLRL